MHEICRRDRIDLVRNISLRAERAKSKPKFQISYPSWLSIEVTSATTASCASFCPWRTKRRIFSNLLQPGESIEARQLFLSHLTVRMHASQNSVKGKSSLLKFKPATVNHGIHRRTPGRGLPDYEWAQLSSCRHDRLETFIAIRALTISKYHNHLPPLNHLFSQKLGGHH